MKPCKAIDLVFKAQPMIETLRWIIKKDCDEGQVKVLIDDIDNWLRAVQVLMTGEGEVTE